MKAITYSKLTHENFTINSLNAFKRFQEVKETWRKIDNRSVLVKNEFKEDWDLNKLRRVAADILAAFDRGCIVYGAFYKQELIGFASLSDSFFGKTNQYIELTMLQVSAPFRRNGIGKELFRLVCNEAKNTKAQKIYISAHPSKESQMFYQKMGCTEAVEINRIIAQNEPFDVQMEYKL